MLVFVGLSRCGWGIFPTASIPLTGVGAGDRFLSPGGSLPLFSLGFPWAGDRFLSLRSGAVTWL